jgi:methyl-accepting chemotaxis protein
LLALTFISIQQIVQLNSTKQNMNVITELTRLSTQNSALVHELQKERGMSAGYIGSSGSKFGQKLRSQRQAVDQALSNRQAYIDSILQNIDNKNILSALNSIDMQLNSLQSNRDAVDRLNIATPDIVRYFTQINTVLLDMAYSIADASTNSDISRAILAYVNLLQSKERAGIERAVVANSLAKGNFAPAAQRTYMRLIAEQNSFITSFEKLADNQTNNQWQGVKNNSAFSQVDSIRKNNLNNLPAGPFATEAGTWFNTATQRIDQLKSFEDALSIALLDQAKLELNKASSALITYLIGVTVIIALSTLLAYLLVSSIQKQTNLLVSGIQHARSNNDLSTRIEIINHDELGTVADNVNQMLETFAAVIDEMSKSSIQLASAVEETSATVAEQTSALEKQQNETTQLAAAINEMGATAQEVASSTQSSADAASDAEEKTTEATQTVTAAVSAISTLASEVEAVGSIITKLNENSVSVAGVLDVIKNVAEQTNLLALNAAIEAARAGEQGRGFAVVADEVRSLAQRTAESATEIENIITSFQTDANSADSVVKNSLEQAEITVEQAHIIETKLDEVNNAISTIRDMSHQIASATEEQVAVNEEVNQNVTRIDDLCQRNASGSAQISAAAQEQSQLASNLQGMANNFKV